MCGIAGFIDFSQQLDQTDLEKMVRTLDHRGPDDRGFEVYRESGFSVGLGQARLAIIDLSAGGHQPMHFNHLSIVFNGEMYNYAEVKAELIALGHQFVSGSDTEVILHAYDQWGIGGLSRFIGMFAFVIFDRKAGKVFLVRDRVGVKPMYYSFVGGRLLFGSELKALMANRYFSREIDHAVLVNYFNHGYVPSPKTIFKESSKLEAGHYLELNLANQQISSTCYWNVTDHFHKPKATMGYEEAKEEMEKLLISACNYRMVADVPVGVFLSGGYDSTCVTALLARHHASTISTFTIGFEIGNNEAPHAKAIANVLGTRHHELYCSAADAQAIISELPYFYDEPFADSSAIPTILVSRMARKHVTVALSADGGDELLGGYQSYKHLEKYVEKLERIPNFARGAAGLAGKALSAAVPASKPQLRHQLNTAAAAILENRKGLAETVLQKMNQMPADYLRKLILWKEGFDKDPYTFNELPELHAVEMAMAMDYKVYLEGDILTKVDRATMSVSLEGREPLLDHRIAEFAASLPVEYKYGITPKRILKDIVHQYVGKEIMDRPKTGFTIPVYDWLKTDLKHLVDAYLNPEAVARAGVLDPVFVNQIVKQFFADKLHYKPLLWKILMFQMWYERWMK